MLPMSASCLRVTVYLRPIEESRIILGYDGDVGVVVFFAAVTSNMAIQDVLP